MLLLPFKGYWSWVKNCLGLDLLLSSLATKLDSPFLSLQRKLLNKNGHLYLAGNYYRKSTKVWFPKNLVCRVRAEVILENLISTQPLLTPLSFKEDYKSDVKSIGPSSITLSKHLISYGAISRGFFDLPRTKSYWD